MAEPAATASVGQADAGASGAIPANPVSSLLEGKDLASEGILSFVNPEALPWVLFVVVVTVLLSRAVSLLARHLGRRVARRRLAFNQASTLIRFALWAIALLVVVTSVFDLSSQALFALSGTVAVAAGFLLKDVAESFVAGIAILIGRPFQVGDRIRFGEYYGEVVEIGLRSVKLVTLDDNLVTIPTNRFSKDVVASANAGNLECMVVVPFYVPVDADHERARDLVREAVLSSRFLYLGKPIVVLTGVVLTEGVGPLVEITAKAYVCDTRYEKAFASDVTAQALAAFREAGERLLPLAPVHANGGAAPAG